MNLTNLKIINYKIIHHNHLLIIHKILKMIINNQGSNKSIIKINHLLNINSFKNKLSFIIH